MKIVNIVGARPNFTKIAPLITEMRRYQKTQPILVHTGQHYDTNMSGVFFEELGIPAPDYNLGIGSGSHTYQTAQVMLALDKLFAEIQPDLVLVVGDVNSTVAGALTASKLRIPLAHVEAGLRSFDRSMPEEVNRVVTDVLSDFLFTSERSANDNLRNEGISGDKIYFVGNVMIDTLLRQRKHALSLQVPERYGLIDNQYALLTLHRPSNVDSKSILKGLLEAVEYLQQHMPVLFPSHPRTQKQLDMFGLTTQLEAFENLRIVPPLGYLEFLGLMSRSQLILTDSGGIQEESTILGIPCLTLRESTERPVTVEVGTNQIVGTEPARIMAAIDSILDGKVKSGNQPELWDGHAAERIVHLIHQEFGHQDAYLD